MASKNTIDKAYREITPVIEEWIRFTGYTYEIPGISMAIQQYDELLSNKAWGKKNLTTGEKLTPDTLFRIASHSKLFTATAIMELYNQGKLSLDDRISKHIDWFKPEEDNIRIRHLLSHTSGITRDAEFGQWEHHNFPDLEEFKTIMQGEVEIMDPALQFKYSNIGYTLLGQIIESITGTTYEDYMKDLLRRLDLNSTFSTLGDRAEVHATGYQRPMPDEERKSFDHVDANSMDSATGFSSIPTDILKFYRAQMVDIDRGLQYGNFIKREMQNLQFKFKDTEWGFGFGRRNIDGMQIVGHGGGYPGFITNSGFILDKQLGFAIFTNTLQPPLNEMVTGLVKLFKFVDEKYSAFDDEDRDFSGYEGLYRSQWRFLLVKQLNNQLLALPVELLNPVPEIMRLKWIDDDTFVIASAPPTSSEGENAYFVPTEDGRELHIGGSIYRSYRYKY